MCVVKMDVDVCCFVCMINLNRREKYVFCLKLEGGIVKELNYILRGWGGGRIK